MTDYKNAPYRFVNIGMNWRDAQDKVTEGNWLLLKNVRSTQEGFLQAREAVQTVYSVSGNVNSMRRLDANTLVAGVGNSLYRNVTPYPTAGYSGNPLSLVPYRPTLTSQNWMYVADSNQMRKVKADGTDYMWGITPPSIAASFSAGAAGNLNSSVAGGSVYDYRYTYYSTATGAESNPSPTATGIAIVNQQGVVSVNASTDPQVSQIKIYRRGGTIAGVWRLALTVVNTSGLYNDNNGDSSIAAANALTEDHDVPFTSVDANGNTLKGVPLPYAWGPFAGKFIFACGDPNRPGFLYWTNAQQPDEADVANNVEVTSPSEPLQNGLIFGSLPYVFSKDELYAIDFGSANTLTPQPRKTPCGKGLAAPWAFCVGDRIYFLGNDGIYATDGGRAVRISELIRPIFKGLTTSEFIPITYSTSTRMEYHENEIWFFYTYRDPSFERAPLLYRWVVYDIQYDRWRTLGEIDNSTRLNFGYSDENVTVSRLLFGGLNFIGNVAPDTGTTIVADFFDTAPKTYDVGVQTGYMDFDLPSTLKEMGNLIIDAEPAGATLTIIVRADINSVTARTLATQTITGLGRQKFTIDLTDEFVYNVSCTVTWTSGLAATTVSAGSPPSVYSMELLWRPDQEVLRHWEFPSSSNNQSGWQHIRDGYMTVRSSADLTLTITVDGAVYTPVFKNGSNTAGEKRKIYFEMPPVKGKVFRYELDSPGDFRIYGDECEVRTKVWNTQLGYQLISPFGGGDT